MPRQVVAFFVVLANTPKQVFGSYALTQRRITTGWASSGLLRA